ncbi:Uncharacterised protein [Mycobacteroides abscessus]|nr:Uncharacterised protein [Mycobacteroides abscessus]
MIGRFSAPFSSARVIASLTTRVYVSRAANPSTAISLAPTSMASCTDSRAHWSEVIGADLSAINATTLCAVSDVATRPHESPDPLSDGSTATTVNTGRDGASGSRQSSIHFCFTSPPAGVVGSPL